MMPMALGLLWLEMEILSRLTIERSAGPVLLGPSGQGRADSCAASVRERAWSGVIKALFSSSRL